MGRPPLSPGRRSCYCRPFPDPCCDPAFPTLGPRLQVCTRSRSAFKFPPPPPKIDRPALPTLSSTLCAFPEAKTFPTRAENFFLPSQRNEAGNQVSRRHHPLCPAPGWLAPFLPGRCAPGDCPTAVARASPTRGRRPVRRPLVACCSELTERVS